MRSLRIALIGSRKLEQEVHFAEDIALCYKVCYRLAELGITFTSGLCALGMDAIAQRTYSDCVLQGKAKENQFEVYVASSYNIAKSNLPNKHLSVVAPEHLKKQREDICLSVMGESHWNRCNDYAKGMHSRNCHQILGIDLNNPVDAVICWTPEGKVVGGTATAIKIALEKNIPVFNLGVKDKKQVLNNIKDFLVKKGIVG